MTAAGKLPGALVTGPNRLGRKVIDPGHVAAVVARAARRRPARATGLDGRASGTVRTRTPAAEAVYFTACVGTMFGPSEAGPGVRESFERICRRAGITLTYPAGLPDLCCGTPWRSKGMKAGYAEMARRVLPALWRASRQGELPIVCDASSCTEGLRQMLESEIAAADPGYAALRIVDAVAFVARACPAAAGATRKSGRWRCTPPARPPGWA